MFGFFKKKTSAPPPDNPSLTAADKDWVEKNMLWFIEVFGYDRLEKDPFLLPTHKYFPYSNLKDEHQFRDFFKQLCEHWKVNSEEIKVNFFDDIKSKQWSNLAPAGAIREPQGLYYQEYTREKERFIVRIARSNFDNPQLLTSVVVHELAHVKLLGENYIRANDPDMEPFTDLATICFGFGIFVANTCETKDNGWLGRSGYLSNEVISYANALICYITGKNAAHYCDHLNTNTRLLFLQDHAWLKHTDDTLLTKSAIEEAKLKFNNYEIINEGFKRKQYDAVIDAAYRLLNLTPNNPGFYNNIGYAYLAQKKYKEAIEAFTNAIIIDPYYDYAYNNRGYCRLQLDDIDNAFADLHSSYEMNPENSFSCRNLGAYYLKTSDYNKALDYFEQAIKIDPKTELIHFYLAYTYRQLNDNDKSLASLAKSREIGEHNDSMFDMD
jgi:tetratricopeptide (TPR) repeat protein